MSKIECCHKTLKYITTAMGIRKKCDANFIFTYFIFTVVVKVRYGGITTAKIFKHVNYLK